ncbi:Domain of unknown function DUF1863 [Anaeromyxobacter dehalogenans 2CP-1]|uniref:Thoeris protein ThsB TIR-like domain-containing protein n=1 Tax=Anaeromyxobacter dehalogenans (strain ATCC BAA-258 / DSM 21875 / 2CP-1) TaxID=455488 RepID=B8JFN8_ANAD2|nr:TIR domain-containing protein [Anaeromyxobacter dehalogenans]ACL64476.1 Domain of unknown function DUF1863 [Anaeromyxobacter dehalogenans 2CP-1]
MARRVYFAFHYERDIFRVNVVRNSNVVLGTTDAGFFDKSEYEEVKRKNPQEIARRLLDKMKGTSVTVVLIGRETWQRSWVAWEIEQSIANKNGLLGVYIHHVSSLGQADPSTPTPPVPAVPRGVLFPIIYWNSRDLSQFAREVEAAGQRSDSLRAAERAAFQLMLAAKLGKKKEWWET